MASNNYVYFIYDTETGLIKIGQSKDPKVRLKHLQSQTKHKLNLMGTIEAPLAEKELHSKYKYLREQGEWFNPDAQLLSYILSIQNQNIFVMSNSEDITAETETPLMIKVVVVLFLVSFWVVLLLAAGQNVIVEWYYHGLTLKQYIDVIAGFIGFTLAYLVSLAVMYASISTDDEEQNKE